MLNKKYNLIISLGEKCGCALYLRSFRLRSHSYPFDWLCNATFETRIDLIVNDFSGFMHKENLKVYDDNPGDLHHDLYEDINTGFVFLHDFPENVPLDKSYPLVYEKYQRRINRLYEKVAQADEVLFVWFSLTSKLSEKMILEAQEKLSAKFNKNINLLIVENDSSVTDVLEMPLNDYALQVKAPFADGKDFVVGNMDLAATVFSRIQAPKKYTYFILKAIMRTFCCLVPSGKLRRKIRTKYENLW